MEQPLQAYERFNGFLQTILKCSSRESDLFPLDQREIETGCLYFEQV